jgi:hypothetical protein
MTPHLQKLSSEAAWLARFQGERLPSSSQDWDAAVRAFPKLLGAGRDPACALLDCLYDDPHKPATAALRELRHLEPDHAVSGVVRWIFGELVRICASESLRKGQVCLNALCKLIRCTGGLLSAELTHFIRVGLAEVDREVRSRR